MYFPSKPPPPPTVAAPTWLQNSRAINNFYFKLQILITLSIFTSNLNLPLSDVLLLIHLYAQISIHHISHLCRDRSHTLARWLMQKGGPLQCLTLVRGALKNITKNFRVKIEFTCFSMGLTSNFHGIKGALNFFFFFFFFFFFWGLKAAPKKIAISYSCMLTGAAHQNEVSSPLWQI